MDEREFIKSLKGYKEKVPITEKATLEWDKELIFIGRTQRGYEIEFDANLQWGCKPTDALVLSLAACTATDVVMFLKKCMWNFQVLRWKFLRKEIPHHLNIISLL